MKHPWFFPAGDYIGQMKNGLAHGKGTYTSSFKGKKKTLEVVLKFFKISD